MGAGCEVLHNGVTSAKSTECFKIKNEWNCTNTISESDAPPFYDSSIRELSTDISFFKSRSPLPCPTMPMSCRPWQGMSCRGCGLEDTAGSNFCHLQLGEEQTHLGRRNSPQAGEVAAAGNRGRARIEAQAVLHAITASVNLKGRDVKS